MKFLRFVVAAIAMIAASMTPCEAQRNEPSVFAPPIAGNSAGAASHRNFANGVRLTHPMHARRMQAADKDDDSLWNGAIIGAVAGAAVGLASNEMAWYADAPSPLLMTLGGAFWGAAIGTFVDYIN